MFLGSKVLLVLSSNNVEILGFEVLSAVTMKNAVFWSMASYRSCENRRFGGKFLIHFQGRKIRQ
jgi:hypothetical protein